MKLISTSEQEEGKIKKYMANALHPLYKNLRGLILKYMGVEHLIEEVFYKLGDLEEFYLTGEITEGKNTPFIDLVVVCDIDRVFFNQLVEKSEELLNKKIRAAVYSQDEFRVSKLKDISNISVFKRGSSD